MSERAIRITEFDRERLLDLLRNARNSDYRGSEYLEKLRAELERAEVLTPRDIPADVITMNSQVVLEDLDTHEEEMYTLVFPENADLEQGKISVLAPVGTAMIGYRVGDVFEWPVPAGIRRLRVKQIRYQPEASGDYDL